MDHSRFASVKAKRKRSSAARRRLLCAGQIADVCAEADDWRGGKERGKLPLKQAELILQALRAAGCGGQTQKHIVMQDHRLDVHIAQRRAKHGFHVRQHAPQAAGLDRVILKIHGEYQKRGPEPGRKVGDMVVRGLQFQKKCAQAGLQQLALLLRRKLLPPCPANRVQACRELVQMLQKRLRRQIQLQNVIGRSLRQRLAHKLKI